MKPIMFVTEINEGFQNINPRKRIMSKIRTNLTKIIQKYLTTNRKFTLVKIEIWTKVQLFPGSYKSR